MSAREPRVIGFWSKSADTWIAAKVGNHSIARQVRSELENHVNCDLDIWAESCDHSDLPDTSTLPIVTGQAATNFLIDKWNEEYAKSTSQ